MEVFFHAADTPLPCPIRCELQNSALAVGVDDVKLVLGNFAVCELLLLATHVWSQALTQLRYSSRSEHQASLLFSRNPSCRLGSSMQSPLLRSPHGLFGSLHGLYSGRSRAPSSALQSVNTSRLHNLSSQTEGMELGHGNKTSIASRYKLVMEGWPRPCIYEFMRCQEARVKDKR